MIDLTDGDRSAVISLATGATIRIGFNAEHRWRGLLYSTVAKPRPVDQHRVDYDLCALRALGLDPKPGMPTVSVSLSEEQVVEKWLQEHGLAGEDTPRRGYPARLAGEAIPLSGRIVAVADVFDALTSARPYKPAWDIERAVDFLKAERGQHFDPACVDAFLDQWAGVLAVRERFQDEEE